MTRRSVRWRDVLGQKREDAPEFRAEWERSAFARAVAIEVIRYRAEHGLSQRQLAKQLQVPQSVIGRLELGEQYPSVETLHRLAKGLGQRFILAVAPPDGTDDLMLPAGARILADVTLADGSRVLAAAG